MSNERLDLAEYTVVECRGLLSRENGRQAHVAALFHKPDEKTSRWVACPRCKEGLCFVEYDNSSWYSIRCDLLQLGTRRRIEFGI